MALLVFGTALGGLGLGGGCEVVDYGDLVVTWRFNGAPLDGEHNPCKVMNANKLPPPVGLVKIELDGPTHFFDYVVCENKELRFPARFYDHLASSPPDVYARVLHDVPKGRYTVTVSFVDRNGQEILDPGPVQTTVKVVREKTKRIDLDFPLTYGRVDVRWTLDDGSGGPALECEAVSATDVQVRLLDEDQNGVEEKTLPCGDGNTRTYPFTPVAPGTYWVEAVLLDAQGDPVSTSQRTAAPTEVAAAQVAETAEITFDATALGLAP
jgi:hypothetical protein